MIVAPRKTNEGFTIGHGAEIRLKVVEIRGDDVLIGIEAPKETSIELYTPQPFVLQQENLPDPRKKRPRSFHKKKRLRWFLKARMLGP
jgi:carbon storage regulator CsrA